ncbi:MAG: hypothetical protein N3E48_03850 [Candidatus Bathyarchaeota archaeon]|nr:hypothetical protein [Candidatus Bathyarchaeota archaeon]
MKCLEIEPLENKKLVVYLLQKEYEEEWKFQKVKPSPLNVYSKKYCEFVKGVAAQCKPDFVVDELGVRSEREYREKDQLSHYLGTQVIPVDMPEDVKNYIESTIETKLSLLNQIKSRLSILYDINFKQIESEWEQKILAWGRYLEDEIKREEENVKTSIREAWMVKKIIDYARKINKKEVKCLFICSIYHFKGIIKLFSNYGVMVHPIKLERDFKEKPGREALSQVEVALK